MEFIYDEQLHSYVIENYDESLNIAKEYLKNNGLQDLVILNDGDKKVVKKARTEIRKKISAIQNVRKKANEIVMGKLNSQCIEIEKTLTEAEQNLKRKIDEYDNKIPLKTYSLIVKSTDVELLKLALIKITEMGLEGDIK